MKRNCIGSIEIDTSKAIFTINTPFDQMRLSEQQICSYLDLLQSKAEFATGSEQTEIYNQMDMYFAVAMIIESLGYSEDILQRCVYCFNEAWNNGRFENNCTLSERNEKLIATIDTIVNSAVNYTINDDYVLDNDLYIWWQKNVIDLNYYIALDGSKTQTQPTIIAISGSDSLQERFKAAGGAYAYTMVSESEVSSSNVARLKRAKQFEARSAIYAACPELNETIQNNYIQARLTEVTQGGNASTLVTALKENGKQKIGLTETIIAAILALVGTFITAAAALATTIIQTRKNNLTNNAYQALDSYPVYTTSENDFALGDIDGDGKDDTAKLLMIGAAALAAYYFLS